MGVAEYERMSKEVEKLFNGEKSTSYFLPRSNTHQAKGDLLVSYNSRIRKLRKADDFPTKNKRMKKDNLQCSEYEKTLISESTFTSEEILAKQYVKGKVQVTNDFLLKWQRCVKVRRFAVLQNDPNFWTDYDILTTAQGPTLVNY